MTRKDYVLLAEAFRVQWNVSNKVARREIVNGVEQVVPFDAGVVTGVHAAASEVADSLHRANPRFDVDHFMAVVRGEKPLTSKPSRDLGIKLNTPEADAFRQERNTQMGEAVRDAIAPISDEERQKIQARRARHKGRP